MNNDFSNITLLNQERYYLFLSRFVNVNKNKHTIHLHRIGFIEPIPTNTRGQFGNRIYTNKYRITDKGKRYSKYIHNDRMHRYFTPITVSIITTILTYIVIEMLEYLLS